MLIINAGVTAFVSAGNGGSELSSTAHFCSVDAFICVSALSDTDGKCGGLGPDDGSYVVPSGRDGLARDDRRAPFSSWGDDVDIMASGVYTLSASTATTDVDGSMTLGSTTYNYIGNSPHGSYQYFGGTSAAAPLAAGIGALIKFKNPSWTPAQVKSSLLSSGYAQTQACDGFGKGGLLSGGQGGANVESNEDILYAQPY